MTKTSTAKLEVELARTQDKREVAKEELEKVERAYKVGLWGVLIGIVLIPAFGLGLLLIFLRAGWRQSPITANARKFVNS